MDNQPINTPAAPKKPKQGPKKPKFQHDERWVKAKARCRLNQEDIEMAKKLGISPISLIKNVPSPQQPWKAPIKVWIHNLYEERFGKNSSSRKPTTKK